MDLLFYLFMYMDNKINFGALLLKNADHHDDS